MAVKTYKGSCHCGAVQFEADIDLAAGSGKCNCTYCTKLRNWSVLIKPEAFKNVKGEEEMTAYMAAGRPEEYGKHLFCKYCGIATFSRGYLEQVGGNYVSIQLASLDDASIDELMSGLVRYADGRNNNWTNPPADVRTL
jgi:hypothetical protein